jgi:dienelactone hydrolase
MSWTLQNVNDVHLTYATFLVIFFILATLGLIWFVVKCNQKNQTCEANSSVSPNKSSLNKMQGYAGAFIASIVLIGISLLGLVIFVVVRAVEQNNLFAPTQTNRYKKITGQWIRLKSGGGVMHCTEHALPNSRRLIFLHGNTGNLDLYDAALRRCASLGYDIYALEFRGYGTTLQDVPAPDRIAPDARSILRDAIECWQAVGDSNAIIMGFSLGGIALGQIYDELAPMPAQLVFLNTFYSFPNLVAEKLGVVGTALNPLLATKWHTRSPKKYHNRVLVVYTADDDVVPAAQGKALCHIFSTLKPDCVELPSGGHRYSTIIHIDKWANSNYLLPAHL